jgi:DNA-binding NtrC family response regulator
MVSCLLIDRNEFTRHLVSQMLAELGIVCSQADSWSFGRQFTRNRYDIVIVGNPEGDDYDHVPASARHRQQHLVFYYFAQHPDVDVISRLIVHGVADVLVMPFDSQILGFKLVQAGVHLRNAAA